MQVAEGMSPTVLTVGPDHNLRAVAKLMSRREVGAAVVIQIVHPALVGGDAGAFDADAVSHRRIDRDLVGGPPWAAPPDAASESGERSVQLGWRDDLVAAG